MIAQGEFNRSPGNSNPPKRTPTLIGMSQGELNLIILTSSPTQIYFPNGCRDIWPSWSHVNLPNPNQEASNFIPIHEQFSSIRGTSNTSLNLVQVNLATRRRCTCSGVSVSLDVSGALIAITLLLKEGLLVGSRAGQFP